MRRLAAIRAAAAVRQHQPAPLEARDRRSLLQRPDQLRRISGVDAGFRNILGDYCSGANHHAIADRYRKNSGVGADAYSTSDPRRHPKLPSAFGRSTNGEQIIHKHGAVRDETVIADGHQFADEGVGLDAAAVANDNVPLDLDKWSDETVVADSAAVEVTRFHDNDVRTERYIHNAHFPKGRRRRLHFINDA